MCPLAPITVTLGDVPVKVKWVGLSPGSIGLAQVNIEIPQLHPGDYPLVVTVGGVASNAAVICVNYPLSGTAPAAGSAATR
jgi:uncharacterized protein (TIGR03437 family)